MNEIQTEVLKILITGMIASIPGLLFFFFQTRKDRGQEKLQKRREDPDTVTKYSDLVDKQIEQIESLRTDLDCIDKKVNALEKDNARYIKILKEWQSGIALLIHQLQANNIPPVWIPKDEKL